MTIDKQLPKSKLTDGYLRSPKWMIWQLDWIDCTVYRVMASLAGVADDQTIMGI